MNIFETKRLLVKEYTLSDGHHFVTLNRNELVMQYIRPVATEEEANNFLQSNMDFYRSRPNMGRWAVVEKFSGEFVGSFALIPLPADADKIQIGYALMPGFWGKGYATELVEHGKVFFFEKHGEEILYAVTELLNIASQKVLLKCGFREELEFNEGEKRLKRFVLPRQTFINSSPC